VTTARSKIFLIRWAALLLLALGAQPALAQRGTQVPRVGILSPYLASGSSFQDDVKRGLAELGHVEGATVAYETSSRMGTRTGFRLLLLSSCSAK
jgi:hypothetical protein